MAKCITAYLKGGPKKGETIELHEFVPVLSFVMGPDIPISYTPMTIDESYEKSTYTKIDYRLVKQSGPRAAIYEYIK
jgi:hypothetical protein